MDVQKEKMKKIQFKDLSTGLKVFIVLAWLLLLMNIASITLTILARTIG